MIVYKDILGKLKDAGYNTSRIRKEKILSQSTMQKIRNGDPSIQLASMGKICSVLKCELSDLVEFIYEE